MNSNKSGILLIEFEDYNDRYGDRYGKYKSPIIISKEKLSEIIKEEKKTQLKSIKGIWTFIKRNLFNKTEE